MNNHKQPLRVRGLSNRHVEYELFDLLCKHIPVGPKGFPTRHNCIYTMKDMHAFLTSAGTSNTTVGGYLNMQKYFDPNMPTDQWFAKIMHGLDMGDVQQFFTDTLHAQLRLFRQYSKIPKKGITVAIDVHDIPRYDKKYGEELKRSKSKKGTKRFESYITLQCVDRGKRLILGVIPMHALDTVADFVPKIMGILLEHKIPVRLVLMDRGFFSAKTIRYFNTANISFLIPCVNTERVIPALREYADGKRRRVSKMVHVWNRM